WFDRGESPDGYRRIVLLPGPWATNCRFHLAVRRADLYRRKRDSEFDFVQPCLHWNGWHRDLCRQLAAVCPVELDRGWRQVGIRRGHRNEQLRAMAALYWRLQVRKHGPAYRVHAR